MLDSLPSRPLSRVEVDALTESDGISLVFPASPESISEDENGTQRIYDLLLFIEETVVAIAYTEKQANWELIAKETDEEDDAYEVVYDQLLEYRGYEALDREDAMRRVITKMYGIPKN